MCEAQCDLVQRVVVFGVGLKNAFPGTLRLVHRAMKDRRAARLASTKQPKDRKGANRYPRPTKRHYSLCRDVKNLSYRD